MTTIITSVTLQQKKVRDMSGVQYYNKKNA